jgi:hypothetical protein
MRSLCQAVANGSRQTAMLALQQGVQKLFGLRLLQKSSAASELKRLLVAERLSGDF